MERKIKTSNLNTKIISQISQITNANIKIKNKRRKFEAKKMLNNSEEEVLWRKKNCCWKYSHEIIDTQLIGSEDEGRH